jgi:hypothetical protein
VPISAKEHYFNASTSGHASNSGGANRDAGSTDIRKVPNSILLRSNPGRSSNREHTQGHNRPGPGPRKL